jgi:hypothetical protein
MSSIARDIYLSVDVETDGPIPGPHSMLSIGAAAFDIERRIIGTFSANLLPLPGAAPHPETAAFWAREPKAYAATRGNLREPAEAMAEYRGFIDALPRRPIFVGYPAAFDHMWHHWYLHCFTGGDPCGFAPLDLKSYAAAMLALPFREAAKRAFPRAWFAGAPSHDHVALTDAIGQGIVAVNMIRANLQLPPIERDAG